jgi:hypothetical protein
MTRQNIWLLQSGVELICKWDYRFSGCGPSLLEGGDVMQCLRCGHQNKATNDLCEGCGATLGIECKACGHLNGPTARFCGRCSTALKTTAAEIPNRSWQHVLSSLNAKGGERKRLTILFADVRNSTELIDNLLAAWTASWLRSARSNRKGHRCAIPWLIYRAAYKIQRDPFGHPESSPRLTDVDFRCQTSKPATYAGRS